MPKTKNEVRPYRKQKMTEERFIILKRAWDAYKIKSPELALLFCEARGLSLATLKRIGEASNFDEYHKIVIKAYQKEKDPAGGSGAAPIQPSLIPDPRLPREEREARALENIARELGNINKAIYVFTAKVSALLTEDQISGGDETPIVVVNNSTPGGKN